ncbi:hypothetical protein C2S53_013539 [Perilla frutescens var. hirtella]|uniref:Uncharacterized protein n=1 Tax=Perilla frutescens var. hirtella TaxID=608512 RepID=A0AAD4PCE7_PERFH|nr:hypothetical protein C2S53_013539 [Perilla frutescens var. hirtella]
MKLAKAVEKGGCGGAVGRVSSGSGIIHFIFLLQENVFAKRFNELCNELQFASCEVEEGSRMEEGRLRRRPRRRDLEMAGEGMAAALLLN